MNYKIKKTVTFLYRAPKIPLQPSNKQVIIKKYKDIFNLSIEEATEMTELTKGYPFAFQVLEYLTWENK